MSSRTRLRSPPLNAWNKVIGKESKGFNVRKIFGEALLKPLSVPLLLVFLGRPKVEVIQSLLLRLLWLEEVGCELKMKTGASTLAPWTGMEPMEESK